METQEVVLEEDCRGAFIPLGVVVVEERGRKALWFLRFSTLSCLEYKVTTRKQTDRQTDACLCVCHPRPQWTRWPRK